MRMLCCAASSVQGPSQGTAAFGADAWHPSPYRRAFVSGLPICGLRRSPRGAIALHGLRVLSPRGQRRPGARELPGQRGGAPAEALEQVPDLQATFQRSVTGGVVPRILGGPSEPPGGGQRPARHFRCASLRPKVQCQVISSPTDFVDISAAVESSGSRVCTHAAC